MYKKAGVCSLLLIFLALMAVSCNKRQERVSVYKIGILQFTDLLTDVEGGLKEGLSQLGYQEGNNVQYIYRNAHGDPEIINEIADDLVNEKVDVIVSITTPATQAARTASQETEIPIVFLLVSDPVLAGFVESSQHPGGRITGLRDGSSATSGKRLELLLMMVPGIEKVLSVYSSEKALLPAEEDLRSAAIKLGVTLIEKRVDNSEEAADAFNSILPGEVDAIFIPSDAVVVRAIDEIKSLSKRDILPYIFPGGIKDTLASYGENHRSAGMQGASLVDKVLKGEDPANTPVELSRNFFFSINLTVTEEIGLNLSDDILVLADQIVR